MYGFLCLCMLESCGSTTLENDFSGVAIFFFFLINKSPKSTSCKAEKKNKENLEILFYYLGFKCSNYSKFQLSSYWYFLGKKRNTLYFCNMLSLFVCLRFISVSCYQLEQYLFPMKKPLVVLAVLSCRLALKWNFQIKRFSSLIRLSLFK